RPRRSRRKRCASCPCCTHCSRCAIRPPKRAYEEASMSNSIFSTFESSRTVPVTGADLASVAQDVMAHFRAKQFEVSGTPTPAGGWHISIAKGDIFRAILGLKTALNIEISPVPEGTE